MLKKVIECTRRLIMEGMGVIVEKGVTDVVRDVIRIEDQVAQYLTICMLRYTKDVGMVIIFVIMFSILAYPTPIPMVSKTATHPLR